jgi:exodeoxyribonuclease VII small subunit
MATPGGMRMQRRHSVREGGRCAAGPPVGPRILPSTSRLHLDKGRAVESACTQRRPEPAQVGPSALTTIVNSLSEMANKTASSDGPAASAASYEDALAELERLVAAMEGGQMPLERLLESYRRGAELLGFCRSRLDAVEQQVKVLEDGQLKPWAES